MKTQYLQLDISLEERAIFCDCGQCTFIRANLVKVRRVLIYSIICPFLWIWLFYKYFQYGNVREFGHLEDELYTKWNSVFGHLLSLIAIYSIIALLILTAIEMKV